MQLFLLHLRVATVVLPPNQQVRYYESCHPPPSTTLLAIAAEGCCAALVVDPLLNSELSNRLSCAVSSRFPIRYDLYFNCVMDYEMDKCISAALLIVLIVEVQWRNRSSTSTCLKYSTIF